MIHSARGIHQDESQRERQIGTLADQPLLELPTDRPRHTQTGPDEAQTPLTLAPNLTAALEAIRIWTDVPVATIVLAAFKSVLYRYTAATNLLVGARIGSAAGRLAVRTDLSGNPDMEQVLQRVHAALLAADEQLHHSAHVQIVFDWAVEPTLLAETGADLQLCLRPQAGTIGGMLSYNRALFDEPTIARLAGHIQMVLTELCADLDLPLNRVPLLSETERAELLYGWNQRTLTLPSGVGLHSLFEAQVARTPEAVALIVGDERLSYAELNRRANRLAHHLRERGVEQETLVGVCLERTSTLVVALLAILKAGGAYVPLDPAYPRDRISFILHDTAAPVVLTEQQLQDRVAEAQGTIVCLDTGWDQPDAAHDDDPAAAVLPDTLAYIIYTSGSTGRPKGVAITHQNAVALLTWAWQTFSGDELAGVLAATSICFDLSIFELFTPLSVGGSVILAKNALALPQLPAANLVTLVNTVPSAIAALVAERGLPASVLTVNLAGEPLKRSLADQVYAADVERVYNLYGPSEDTTYSTFALVERADTREPTIGRPLASTHAYILDHLLQPVPVGVTGELYLSGAGVSRGYLGQPALTAERYLPDPFSKQPGARMYKTGDLTRYRASGEIEFLGRIDHQIKIRGYRIELGEIEAALSRHAAVASAIVVAHSYEADKRLVAYVVETPRTENGEQETADRSLAADPRSLTSGLLRSFLHDQLPEYMIPAAFVVLDALPLLPNGKINRAALPVPDLARVEGNNFVAPRDETEQVVATIWEQVFGLTGIGVHDSFFDLGGHSLLATQISSRISRELHIAISPQDLFEQPTVADLAEHIRWSLPELHQAPQLARTARETMLPLSFAQQRLWFFNQLTPDSPVYNVPLVVQIDGTLDRAALQHSLDTIVRRHESLRTRFVEHDDRAVQVIAPPEPVVLSYLDLRSHDRVERAEVAREMMIEQARQPFDLQHGPLLRALLVQLEQAEYRLLIAVHHIAFDGWSISVLLRELGVIYAQATADAAELRPLPELPIQYADFSLWQRRLLQGEQLEQQLAYWRTYLRGHGGAQPATLELLTDRPRPATQSFQGGRVIQPLDPQLVSALEQLGYQEQATLFMVLMATFQTLLARYSGQHDFVVGTPIANRNRTEIEDLIGFFVNTLPLRADLSGEPSFLEVLSRVRQAAIQAYAHQDLPFEMLIHALGIERDASRNPLFQAMFVLQNTPKQVVDLPQLHMHMAEELHTGTAMFDLTLMIDFLADGPVVAIEYSSDLFDHATIERMLSHYQTLLRNVLAQPTEPIARLPLLSDAEQQQLVALGSRTRSAYPRHSSIAELFEQQAARTPDAIALISGDQTITYRELNERANWLAHLLRQEGVQLETLVGVCLERSPKLIIALLAILKAGGAYLPLDPNYPQERLALMLEDAQVSVLLSEDGLLERLPTHAATALCLDELPAAPDQTYTANLPHIATGDHLAYVMYTSGSTGRPKGVCVPQRGVVRLVTATNYAHFDADETFLQLAPVSFDASTLEIWGSLLNGAQLVIFPPHIPTLEELARTLEHNRITTLWLTAGLFHQMVRDQPQALRGVRQLLAGGDVLGVPQVLQVLQQHAGTTLINGYGPTENTTFTTCHPLRDTAQVGHSVSIGRPIANTQVYVLDAQMQPAPLGVPGELYVGGDGLARNYLHRPALTAEKFVPHPFAQTPGERLYRTGDRVRWLPDGTLEFLGRVDQQVKLRGFRIELGEIEAALLAHPAVCEAVVVVREDALSADGPVDKRLVAYVVVEEPGTQNGEPGAVSTSGQSTSQIGSAHGSPFSALNASSELRSFLRQTLPEYMVPAAVVLLQELPLTANSKLDRGALPAPQAVHTYQQEHLPPSTTTEQRLAELWTKLLGVERPGRQDNFFDLGGHSLLATQLVSAIRSRFTVELPLLALFNSPTIAGLAAVIDAHGQGVQTPELSVSQSSGDQPLSFAQQRLWFFNQWQPDSALYNIVVANRLRGTLDLTMLEHCLNQLVRRHAALRTTFPIVGQEPVQRVADQLSLRLRLLDVSDLPLAEREDLALQHAQVETRQPFDLVHGPLVRAAAVRLSPEHHIFVLSMHHIISDGWSMQILLRELFTLYERSTGGAPAQAEELPPLPVQYTDFAAWQHGWLAPDAPGAALDEQLGYWQQTLTGAPTLLELPTDRPRPAVQSFRGAVASFDLSQELSRELLALSQREAVTPFMTLLSAWATLLARYSGQQELIIGVPVAGRTRTEIDQVIGCFVNTLALRIDLSGNPGFQELLGRVHDIALGGFAHQDLPFERLVTALHPDRTLSHNPLFQVMFAFQSQDFTQLKLPQITVSPLQIDPQTAMFDLTLDVISTEQGLRAMLEYSTDLFDELTIERLISHFQQLLAAIVAAPGTPVARLPLLPQGETNALLARRLGEPVSYPQDRCVHTLFEQQAARTPDATALVCGTEQLSYGELNRRANQLAHSLIARGVRPEMLVGIAIERSAEMIIGLLGILKAGGAYVPLDPSYPQQRLSYILNDARVPLLLTTAAVQPRLAEYQGQMLCLDTDWASVAGQPVTNPQTAVRADNLMYVIYTSGSTGQPKGVMLQHRSVCNHAYWMQQRFPLGPDDAVLQHTSFSFDVSVWEIFAPLLRGVRLVLAQPEGEKDPAYLTRLIAEQRVTILQTVPSLLRMLLEQPDAARCTALRRVFCGGEAMPLDLPAQLRATSTATLINMYGPTETTIDATYWICPADRTPSTIPIGAPVGNADAYVLDPHGQLVPIGVPGELYIGGAGVARGYLDRPALTAERFVPDPFAQTPGAQLYRTGDRVRWLPDGTIEFLGRIDQQVKLRGFRIELGEIEAALLAHPAVREAAVMVREALAPASGHLDQRLVAYIVAGIRGNELDSAPIPPSDLRAFLGERLPDYMIPAAFVQLDALPLTPNGKLDRQALPALDLAQIETGTVYVAPRSTTERMLAEVWAAVTGSAQVGIHDNFFELGGNSLLATRIVAQVRERAHIELPLRALFESPTVAALAALIDEQVPQSTARADVSAELIDMDAAQSLLADFTDLSDDDVERLLLSMLSEEDMTSYE